MERKFDMACSDLKNEIAHAVQAAIDKFSKETGVEPTAVDVDIEEVTNHSDRIRRYRVSSVRVGFQSY